LVKISIHHEVLKNEQKAFRRLEMKKKNRCKNMFVNSEKQQTELFHFVHFI